MSFSGRAARIKMLALNFSAKHRYIQICTCHWMHTILTFLQNMLHHSSYYSTCLWADFLNREVGFTDAKAAKPVTAIQNWFHHLWPQRIFLWETGTISSHVCGDQSRYIKPKWGILQTQTNFLCQNLFCAHIALCCRIMTLYMCCSTIRQHLGYCLCLSTSFL